MTLPVTAETAVSQSLDAYRQPGIEVEGSIGDGWGRRAIGGSIDATETVTRIVDFFPPHQHNQIRTSLAGALKGTVAQRLVRRADGNGRVPAVEVMVVNGRIRQCIEDMEHTSDIAEIIADGEYYGMQTFDQSLAVHMENGVVTLEEALEMASNPHDLRVMLERRGLVRTGRG